MTETPDVLATLVQETLNASLSTSLPTETTAAQLPTEPSAPAQPTDTAVVLPTATTKQLDTVPLGFTMGSPKLKASDPATVSFSIGQPQVVEYFAFW